MIYLGRTEDKPSGTCGAVMEWVVLLFESDSFKGRVLRRSCRNEEFNGERLGSGASMPRSSHPNRPIVLPAVISRLPIFLLGMFVRCRIRIRLLPRYLSTRPGMTSLIA